VRLGQDARKLSVGERPIGHNEIVGPFQSRPNSSNLIHRIDRGETTGQRQEEQVLWSHIRAKKRRDEQ
jgi:hypothetical protein